MNLSQTGGPLLALNGRVIGVNVCKMTEQGLNLALPSEYAIKFIRAAEKIATNSQQSSRGAVFGATMLSITPEILNQLKERGMKLDKVKTGVLLIRVASGSKAEKCGLMQGDVLIELNGCKMMNAEEVHKVFDASSNLSMLIVRKDEKIKINVKV